MGISGPVPLPARTVECPPVPLNLPFPFLRPIRCPFGQQQRQCFDFARDSGGAPPATVGPPSIVQRRSDVTEGTRFEHLISEGFELRKTVAEQAEMMASGGTSSEMQAANRNAISARGFELEARRMAGLMRDKFNLAFIDVGGWDTHVNEGNAQGQLSNLLGNLGQGLAVFAEQMGPAWSKTVVVVISEFGRTFCENGTRGTDHGHGTVYWVLGGSVRGGRMAGDQVAVERGTLNQDRDWPVLNEYRSLFGGLFKVVFGLDAARVDKVFPRTGARDIGLV